MASAGETFKKTGTRAAEGAAIGSMFGPGYGTAIGAAAGGIEGFIESLFGGGDSGQAATDAAGAEKMRRMEQAAQILGVQREHRQQSQMNALANRMGAYQGANNVLASMYGPQGSMAPNLSLNGGGPTTGTGHLPDPNAGSHAGYMAGSGAKPVVGPADPAHVAPGPGYTWQSQGTQGGGVWKAPPDPNAGSMAGFRAGAGAPLVSRIPSLSPAIASIAQQMGGPAPAAARPPLRRAV